MYSVACAFILRSPRLSVNFATIFDDLSHNEDRHNHSPEYRICDYGARYKKRVESRSHLHPAPADNPACPSTPCMICRRKTPGSPCARPAAYPSPVTRRQSHPRCRKYSRSSTSFVRSPLKKRSVNICVTPPRPSPHFGVEKPGTIQNQRLCCRSREYHRKLATEATRLSGPDIKIIIERLIRQSHLNAIIIKSLLTFRQLHLLFQ